VSATFVGLIVTQIPSGYLFNRFDNRTIVGAGALAFALLCVVIQSTQRFEMFLLLRGVGGVLVGLVFTGGANIVGYVARPHQQGVATGIYLASPPMAFAIAHAMGPVVGRIYGPLWVFLVHGAVAVLGLLLFGYAARQPIRSETAPDIDEFFLALRNRAVLYVSLSAFCTYALYVFLNSWLPTYGLENLSLSLTDAGFVTAAVPLAGVLARTSGGWLSNRIGRRPVLAAGLLVSFVSLLLIPLTDTIVLFIVLATCAGFAVQLGIGVYFVLTRELAASGTEATSLSVLTTILFTGSFSAGIGGGWLISTYSWTLTLIVFAGVGILGVLVLAPIRSTLQ
jgi:predicted MFS family arabinose efflux permease